MDKIKIRAKLKPITEFLNAKLSQRIVYWVFLSIIVIEVIILVPSVLRREQELLRYLRSLSTAQTLGLLDSQDFSRLSGEALLDRLAAIEGNEIVLGGSLYQQSGEIIGSFGEPPQLTLQDSQQGWRDARYRRWQDRYDAPWDMSPLDGQYVLIVRHDATWVRQEFFGFIGRIAGLVVIISVFVTGATLFVLRRILIKPILQLRQDLLKAGIAIRDDCDTCSLTFQSLHAMRNDELGDVIAAFDQMFGQITDAIATRKQSENRFRTLVEQAVEAFFVLDHTGRIIDINQNACDSLGYSRKELLELTLPDVQPTLTLEDFEHLWQCLRPNQPHTLEGNHQRKNGRIFPVEIRLGLIDTDQSRYILALARDITDRKASQQAMARLAEIGELAAMIVHEVRSPLTTVLMGLHSFQTLNLSERARMRLNLALEESDRLQSLLNEILLYARQQTLDLQSLDLNQLVLDVDASLLDHPTLCDRHLNLVLPPQPLIIQGDRGKLKQVLINLVTNACEACHQGDEVTWKVKLGDQQQVLITVHNGGEPIPPEILPKLTQPFFTTKSSGNGLGLAITKRIIEAHQGTLQITSSRQSGTLVIVTLPRFPQTEAVGPMDIPFSLAPSDPSGLSAAHRSTMGVHPRGLLMSLYTSEELQVIATAPMFTGLAVAMVDMGIVSTAIEATALSKQIAGAADQYPSNSVIQAAFSEEAFQNNQVKRAKPDIQPEDVKSGAVVDQAIAAINAAIAVIESKATAEAVTEYKQFIYDCGKAVAEAVGSGLFGTGKKVSAEEAAALEKLKTALGI